MKYYILYLFIGLSTTLSAQITDSLKVGRLELRLEPGLVDFIPCGKEWFQVQKDAWKLEIDKDPRNKRSWENYYIACKGFWEEDTLLKKKELPQLLRKMKKYIPNTRLYYQLLDDEVITPDKHKLEEIRRKIVSLKRDCEMDYRDDIVYYQQQGRMDKVEEVARAWFDSGLYSSTILSYCYNELIGLEKNAILAGARYQWSYCLLLQYGMGLFKDVELVDLNDLMNPDSESQFWKEKGVDTQLLPKRREIECPGAWYFAVKENRPVYITQSGSGMSLERMQDFLYSEGLVFRYSLKPYDNMAVMRKNYEQVYLLDYLRFPVVMDALRNNDRYILAFLPLLKFYQVSGDKNQFLKLRRLLLSIVDRMDNDYFKNKPWVTTEMVERMKLTKAIFDRMDEMERQGDSPVASFSFKEEHRKEYQQLIEMVEP